MPEGWGPDDAGTIMAEEEVIADFDVESDEEEIVEGLAHGCKRFFLKCGGPCPHGRH